MFPPGIPPEYFPRLDSVEGVMSVTSGALVSQDCFHHPRFHLSKVLFIIQFLVRQEFFHHSSQGYKKLFSQLGAGWMKIQLLK